MTLERGYFGILLFVDDVILLSFPLFTDLIDQLVVLFGNGISREVFRPT